MSDESEAVGIRYDSGERVRKKQTLYERRLPRGFGLIGFGVQTPTFNKLVMRRGYRPVDGVIEAATQLLQINEDSVLGNLVGPFLNFRKIPRSTYKRPELGVDERSYHDDPANDDAIYRQLLGSYCTGREFDASLYELDEKLSQGDRRKVWIPHASTSKRVH